MKTGVIAIAGMLSLAVGGIAAEAIDSRVIHNYNYIGLGYGYLHDVGDSDVNGHGAVAEFSFEQDNFLLGVSGGYFWLTDTGDTDINLWNVTPSIGYVVRLLDNHVNIIPRVAGSYGGIQVDDPVFGDDSDESWSILPGIGLSYAINNQFAINGGYTYAYNFDAEDEDHLFNVGGKVAILEQVGLSVNAQFSKEFGFSGITGMVEFHY